MNGKVRFYDTEKGFGFIDCEDGSSYFFHIKSCPELDQKAKHELTGKEAQFELITNPKPEKGGFVASNVRFS